MNGVSVWFFPTSYSRVLIFNRCILLPPLPLLLTHAKQRDESTRDTSERQTLRNTHRQTHTELSHIVFCKRPLVEGLAVWMSAAPCSAICCECPSWSCLFRLSQIPRKIMKGDKLWETRRLCFFIYCLIDFEMVKNIIGKLYSKRNV